MSTTQHWIVRALTRGGCAAANDIAVPVSANVRDAWRAAGAALGVSQDEVAVYVARAYRLEVADTASAAPTAAKLLPQSVARKYAVVALQDRDRTIEVATSDPNNLDAESEIGFASGRAPVMRIAPPETIDRAIEVAYSEDGAIESLLRLVGDDADNLVSAVDQPQRERVNLEDTASPPVVRLTNVILSEAIRERASDIHIHPTPTGGSVRFRVDGVLRTAMQIPAAVTTRVVSRIKILSNLDIADSVRPQDGRMRVSIRERIYDLRVSTIPTRQAEKCVLRVLDPAGAKTLEQSGLPARELAQLRRQLNNRDGIVLVTGPTGSGKTTTLYGALREISTEDLNTVTVEDPIEYEMPRLTQVQVDVKRGVTFASALRAILRQDPDVLMIGEIRDEETAKIGVQASLTGHLVLASVHANDALGSVRRMIDLGVDPASITETLRAGFAQRLVRRVCTDCSQPATEPWTSEETRLAAEHHCPPTVRVVGCDKCTQSGYRGRLPIVELFEMTPALARLIQTGAPMVDLQRAAVANGMRTLLESGLDRVRAGETTLEEVLRVLGEQSVDSESPAEETSSAASDEPAPETAKPRALVVDDDGANRMILRALIEREGFDVAEAKDGQEALDWLKARNPVNLVILDLDMPRMGGREVLAHIRGSAATASLPVLVLTGSPDLDSEIELLDLGADDYLRKPLDPMRLVTRVRATLRRARG